MDWTIKFADLAIIFATLGGPFLAVQLQKWLERQRDVDGRRLAVFRTLMSTRAGPIVSDHVNAINAIPLEFYGVPPVRAAWDAYMLHVGKDTSAHGWAEKRIALYIDLLMKIGKTCKFKFESAELERGFYWPTGTMALHNDTDAIRQGIAAIVRGEKALPMEVTAIRGDPEAATQFKSALTKLNIWLDREATREMPVTQKTPADRGLRE